MRCRIAIPTFNRASLLPRAIRSALDQSHPDLEVLVVDDASTDETPQVVAEFLPDRRLGYVRLETNVGAAAAKNLAIALGAYEAITFHDSDDLAERDKLIRQLAALKKANVRADPILNWAMAGRPAGGRLEVGVALTEHWLLDGDGGRRRIRRALSLVDDFFPQLQMNAGPLGDWILINPGLFRRCVFQRVGGFEHCVEEDRELRNRLLMHGEIVWLVEEPLLTKIECEDSLTATEATGYLSRRRALDRNLVWERAAAFRAGGPAPTAPLALERVVVASVSDGRWLHLASDLPIASPPRMPA